MKKVLAIALLASAAVTLNGCIAVAAPIIASGLIGKKQFFDKRRDEDLPSSSRAPVAAATKRGKKGAAPTPGAIAVPQAVPVATAPAGPPAPIPGTVPPGMQYLYGSGEASAISIQAYLALTDFLLARASDFQVGHPVPSVVLAPGSTLAAPRFMTCGPSQKPAVVLDIDETALMNLGYEADDSQRSGPYDQDRWNRWEATGLGGVDAVPGAVEAVRAARVAGITVVFNSNRNASSANATESALAIAGLGPVTHLKDLWLKGDEGKPMSGKDPRRWAISAKYCVIAMVGDQLGDFSDLFNAPELTPADRRKLTNAPLIRMLWGHGWFVLPNPVYGTALKGGLNEVFPLDRRWTDPGPPAAAAPAANQPMPLPVK